jgi:hypothetical protein
MHVDADLSSLSGEGNVRRVASDLRVEVGKDAYQGTLDVAIKADRSGLDRGATDLSGSTVAFTSEAASATDPWWARVLIREAAMHLDGEPRIEATVHMTAENASPLQALLARVTPVPRWVLDAFPTENVKADGEFRGTPSSLEARSVVAKSSGTQVRLEYARHDAEKQGLALVSSGSLRMGFTLAGSGPRFLLFGAEGWFDHQVESLRARANEL